MNALTQPAASSQHDGPADLGHWATFFRPLLACVSNPPGEQEFRARVMAIAATVDAPRSLLTSWRQKEAMRRFKFFPTPAEVWDWLAPDLREIRQVASMRSLPAPEPEAPRARTMEEILAVRTKAREAVAELRAAADAKASRPVEIRPSYLSPAALLPHYERLAREGSAAAATRAAALRRQIEQEAEISAGERQA